MEERERLGATQIAAGPMVAGFGTAFDLRIVAMRIAAVTILLLLVGAGCARAPKPTGIHRYGDVTASSLAFDPPVIVDEPRLELSRADRGPAAFVGYEEIITTHFYLRQDDHQRWFDRDGGQFQRRAITEEYGTRYR